MKSQHQSVSGRILISEKNPAFRKAKAYVYLEDTTYADAESVVVAESVLEDINHDGNETEIPFRLEITDESRIDPKNFYSVRVWINVDGEGEISKEDLLSLRAYRVLTQGFGDFVEIRL